MYYSSIYVFTGTPKDTEVICVIFQYNIYKTCGENKKRDRKKRQNNQKKFQINLQNYDKFITDNSICTSYIFAESILYYVLFYKTKSYSFHNKTYVTPVCFVKDDNKMDSYNMRLDK